MKKIVLVIPEKARGWILEGICREIETWFSGEATYCYDLRKIPAGADAYFYAHYAFYISAVIKKPSLLSENNLVWYTHPRELSITEVEMIELFNKSGKILITNSIFKEDLVSKGLDESKAKVVLGGADPHMFNPYKTRVPFKFILSFKLNSLKKKMNTIGFCSAFYERKNPDLILKLINQFPNYNYLIVGKDWEKSSIFKDLKRKRNVSIVEARYKDYPYLYSLMDVFVSPSLLEGGPIPLVEAMMMGLPVVSSNTGFAKDIIEENVNGYIFEVDDPIDDIFNKVIKAFDLNSRDILEKAKNLTWKSFVQEIEKYV